MLRPDVRTPPSFFLVLIVSVLATGIRQSKGFKSVGFRLRLYPTYKKSPPPVGAISESRRVTSATPPPQSPLGEGGSIDRIGSAIVFSSCTAFLVWLSDGTYRLRYSLSRSSGFPNKFRTLCAVPIFAPTAFFLDTCILHVVLSIIMDNTRSTQNL